MGRDLDALLAALTLDEKAALTAGLDMWAVPGLPEHGIPAVTVTDGPNGARGAALLGAGRVSALCVPCGSALGATWDPQLVEEVGAALGEALGAFPGANHRVAYDERLLVGYRWYDTRALPVRYPFGHGGSYTSFSWGEPKVVRPGGSCARSTRCGPLRGRPSSRGSSCLRGRSPPGTRARRIRRTSRGPSRTWSRRSK